MDKRKVIIVVGVVVLLTVSITYSIMSDAEPEPTQNQKAKIQGEMRVEKFTTSPQEAEVEVPVPQRTELEDGTTLVVPKGTKARTTVPVRVEKEAKKPDPPKERAAPANRQPHQEREASVSRTTNNVLVYHNHQNKVIVVQRQESGLSQPALQRVRYQGRSPGQALDEYFDGAWSNGCQPRRSYRSRSWGRGSWGQRDSGEALDDFFDDGGW